MLGLFLAGPADRPANQTPEDRTEHAREQHAQCIHQFIREHVGQVYPAQNRKNQVQREKDDENADGREGTPLCPLGD